MSSRIVLDFVDMYKNYFSYDENTANKIYSKNFTNNTNTNEPFSSLVKKFENEVVKNQALVVNHEVLIKKQLKELESMDDYMGRILKPYIEGALINGEQIEEAINCVQKKMLEVYGYEQQLNSHKTNCDNSIRKLEILKLGIVKSEKIINAERKEAERKEAERRELERRELKEAERRELERRELKEAERRELERRELKETELERRNVERKKEQLNDDLDSLIYSRTSRERIAEIAEDRIKKNLNRGKPQIINGSLSFNNRDKYPMDSSQWNYL